MLAGQMGARGCRISGGVREQNKMDPPAGDAPAGSLYKRNPQAAAWRRKMVAVSGAAPDEAGL